MLVKSFTTQKANFSSLGMTGITSLNVQKNPPEQLSGPRVFFEERFLVMDLISLKHIVQFKFRISFCVFFEIHSFHLNI